MVSYLRLDEAQNNLLLINRVDMREKFSKTFEVIWKSEGKRDCENKEVIAANIQHVDAGDFCGEGSFDGWNMCLKFHGNHIYSF